MTSLTTSGSVPSPSEVESTTSQNTIVTVFRTSRARPPSAGSGAPHIPQTRNRPGFSWPHFGQAAMRQFTTAGARGQTRDG
jgi:hypothetical protein